MRRMTAAIGAAVAMACAPTAGALPWGAERGGNADGSIAAWSGPQGVTTYRGDRIVDPFSGDRPILMIDRSNFQRYRENLSAGQIAMLLRYPTYRIPVYPTRRIFDLPSWAKAAVEGEVGGISLVGDSGLQGLDQTTVPFPSPNNGLEAIWNHITRFRGATVRRNAYTVPVRANGAQVVGRNEELISFRRGLEDTSTNENVLVKYLNVAREPARFQGTIVLVHEYIDQVKNPRDAWIYNSGARRVLRVPTLAYDSPLEFSDAGATTDDFDMYNGAPDKYNWKLLGKREMFIPVNGFRMAGASAVEDLLAVGHFNPDFTRYEKRRVWVVEATLKPNDRHIYERRVFYLDEDGWVITLADQYDARGDLWRVKELHTAFISTNAARFNTGMAVYDLKRGGYLAVGLLAGSKSSIRFDTEIRDREFTPNSLRRKGR